MPRPVALRPELDVPRMWIKPYYASFNGLRGVAVLMVFLSHYTVFFPHNLAAWTFEGVDLFFVLSGFLITGILVDSLEWRHFFRTFYVRRALRIFPLFYGFFLVLLVLTPIVRLRYDPRMVLFMLYVGNLTVPFTNVALHNPTIVSMVREGHRLPIMNIGHFWSLCVEEQFYLIWPAIVWRVRDRKRLMRVCLTLCAATVAGRCFVTLLGLSAIKSGMLFWGTYSRCDTLLVGAWLALWLRGTPLSVLRLRRISNALIFGASLTLFVTLALSDRSMRITANRAMTSTGFSLIALVAAGVLLRSLEEDGWMSKLLQNRALRWLGTISYGFYIFHLLPIEFWKRFAVAHPQWKYGIPFVQFGITLGLAWLSFRYLESPFLRLKRKLAPQGGGEAGLGHLHVAEPEPVG